MKQPRQPEWYRNSGISGPAFGRLPRTRRRWRGFAEVVAVEDQIALGCREQTEIEQMTTTASLWRIVGSNAIFQ
jgi:hypothetical protein